MVVTLLAAAFLLAYWALDEASGDALDSSANEYDLTQVGTVGTVDGKVDEGRLFDGAGVTTADYFIHESAGFADFGNTNFTICFWFRPQATVEEFASDKMLLMKGDYGTTYDWFIRVTGNPDLTTYVGGLDLIFHTGLLSSSTDLRVPISTDTIPVTDGWYFGYVRRSGVVFEIGAVLPGGDVVFSGDTATGSGPTMPSDSTDLTLGMALSGGSPIADQEWEGGIDGVGIWLRALSECELYKVIRRRNFSQFDTDPCQ